MAKAEASVEELVGMIERGELRLPEMQRRFVWRSTRVRDLLDSLYRGYPSGAILLWETDEPVPQQEFAVDQQRNPYQSTRLLLDGQQRLTSLSAVIRGEPVSVRGRRRPIDVLFNLDHLTARRARSSRSTTTQRTPTTTRSKRTRTAHRTRRNDRTSSRSSSRTTPCWPIRDGSACPR